MSSQSFNKGDIISCGIAVGIFERKDADVRNGHWVSIYALKSCDRLVQTEGRSNFHKATPEEVKWFKKVLAKNKLSYVDGKIISEF